MPFDKLRTQVFSACACRRRAEWSRVDKAATFGQQERHRRGDFLGLPDPA